MSGKIAVGRNPCLDGHNSTVCSIILYRFIYSLLCSNCKPPIHLPLRLVSSVSWYWRPSGLRPILESPKYCCKNPNSQAGWRSCIISSQSLYLRQGFSFDMLLWQTRIWSFLVQASAEKANSSIVVSCRNMISMLNAVQLNPLKFSLLSLLLTRLLNWCSPRRQCDKVSLCYTVCKGLVATGSWNLMLVLHQEGQPEDLQDRKNWVWWKVNKWVMNIIYHLFSRYGSNKKHTKGSTEYQFHERWQLCSTQFLEDHMAVAVHLMQASSLKGWLSSTPL